jgi:hypothetical protein
MQLAAPSHLRDHDVLPSGPIVNRRVKSHAEAVLVDLGVHAGRHQRAVLGLALACIWG